MNDSTLFRFVRSSGIISRLVGAFLLVAGVLKAISPTHVVSGLYQITESWTVSRVVLVAAVGVESMIGTWSMLTRSVGRASLVQLALLAAYSAYLVVHGFSIGWDTSCGCGLFGESTAVALVRNAVLMLALGAQARVRSGTRSRVGPETPAPSGSVAP